MSAPTLATLRQLEGRHVAVQLSDGSRIDDCELVTAPRRGRSTLWLLVGGDDRMLALDDVAQLWART